MKHFPFAGFASVVLASFFLTGCGSAPQATPVAMGVSPLLRQVDGQVFVKRGSVLFHAKTGTVLHRGDMIETDASSSADILWPEYGHTLIASGSSVVLTETKNSGPTFVGRLKIESGRVWTRLQKLLDADSAFDVTAGSVVSIVRGTSFGVTRLASSALVQVTESKVGVAHESKDAEVSVPAGQETDAPFVGQIPAPRALAAQELDDPFLRAGDATLSDADLHATSTETEPTGPNGQAVDVITYLGRQIPLDQTYVGTGSDCDAPHYHAKSGTVISIDGMPIQDPEGCGFGRLTETPTERVTLE